MLYFLLNPRWAPKPAKIEIFPFCIEYSYTILWIKNLLKIAGPKSGENQNLYYPMGQKFNRKRLIPLNPRWPQKPAYIAI